MKENDWQSDAGRWAVYGKVRGYWLRFGEPMKKERAFEEVAALKSEGRVEQPHAVPL